MNIQVAKITLEKINRLFASMEADSEHISPIERDLMKSYVTHLYEAVAFPSSNVPPPIKPLQPQHEPLPKPPVPTPTPVIVQPEPVQETEKSPVSHKPTPLSTPQSNKDTEGLKDLFERDQVKELADKLSGSPLNDLTRAFSINDRLFFTSELFSKDQQAFQETLQTINGFSSFQEAQEYLIKEIAPKHQWADVTKRVPAKSFVKVVRRRFNS